MSLSTTSGEYVVAAGKASPPLAITGLGVAGLELEAWVLLATLIYTVLQIALLIHKFFKDRSADKETPDVSE